MAPQPAKRTWIIEEERDPETGQPLGTYDRMQAAQLFADVEAVLFTVGGMVNFAADRVEIGRFGSEPVYESRRLVANWQAFSPGRAEAREPEPVAVGADEGGDDDE